MSQRSNQIVSDVLSACWIFFRAALIIGITVICFFAVSIFWPLAILLIVLFPVSFLAFGDWMGRFKVF
ncbi:MAG: hypothetical protein IJS14_07850 [Lentisphaeria bacterium]|nr:hypothetical protein [Lentisphaeria bacterium]